MRKELRLTEPNNGKHVLAYLVDLAITIASSFAIYFILLYAVFSNIGTYKNSKNTVNNMNETYSLNLESNLDYTEYEKVIQDFYFNYYTDELISDYAEYGYEGYTIQHIYNITVLNLPATPTVSSYSTSLYKYVSNDDGTFNVDVIGEKVEGSGSTYVKNMRDLFLTTYNKLPRLLASYNLEYNTASNYIEKMNMVNRFISVGSSSLIFYLLVPLITKYDSTIMEKVEHLGYVNSKNGYMAPKWKIILKWLIIWIIPFIGLIGFTKYSIVCLMVLPLFINILLVIFTKNHGQLSDIILGLTCVDSEDSLIFANKEDEDKYSNAEVEDEEFIKRLEKLSAIDEKAIEESKDIKK